MVRLGIEGLLVGQTHCVNVYLSKTLYLLLDTGSTQEDRKSSQRDLKIVDRGRKASNQINKNRLCLYGLSLT